MAGIDKVLQEKEIRDFQHHEVLRERASREMQNKAARHETVKLKLSDSSTDTEASENSDHAGERRTPLHQNWLQLSTTLSNLSAAASAMGQDVSGFNISQSTN